MSTIVKNQNLMTVVKAGAAQFVVSAQPPPQPSGELAWWIELPNLEDFTGAPALSVIQDPTDDMKIQVDWMVTNTTGGCLFGIPYNDNDNEDYRVFNYQYRTFFDRGDGRLYNGSNLFPVTTRTLVEFGNYYISSEYGEENAGSSSSYTPPTSPLGFYGYAYIYGLKIWQGDTLVRDMVPWRDENGVGCLSCQVSNKLYYARDGVTVNVDPGD